MTINNINNNLRQNIAAKQIQAKVREKLIRHAHISDDDMINKITPNQIHTNPLIRQKGKKWLNAVTIRPSIKRIKAYLINESNTDKSEWFQKLHKQMMAIKMPLTSENIREFIPKNTDTNYDYARELAGELEKAEIIRASIKAGINPNPTLPEEGFAFIKHDQKVIQEIETFANAVYDMAIKDEKCKEHFNNNGYIWVDMNNPINDKDEVPIILFNPTPIGQHLLKLDNNQHKNLESIIKEFKHNISTQLKQQTENDILFDHIGSALTLQIGINQNAEGHHKDNPVVWQYADFDEHNNNIQALTITHALNKDEQTELIPAGLKPFIHNGTKINSDYLEIQKFERTNIPREFIVSSGKFSYTSAFPAETMGDVRVDFNNHKRRNSIIHATPENRKEQAGTRMFLFGRGLSYHKNEQGKNFDQNISNIFETVFNISDNVKKIEYLCETIEKSNDIDDKNKKFLEKSAESHTVFLLLKLLSESDGTKQNEQLSALKKTAPQEVLEKIISDISMHLNDVQINILQKALQESQ